MDLSNLDIVAAKVVSDPSSDLLSLGKGRKSSGDNGKMERGVWIQFNSCVSIFALYWHHICSILGEHQEALGAGKARYLHSFMR